MMNKKGDGYNWTISDNSECSCLGSLRTNHDRFLSKYTFLYHPSKANQITHVNSQRGFNKNNAKKSLKRAFIPLFNHNKQNKHKNTVLNAKRENLGSKLVKSRSLKKAVSSQSKKVVPHNPAIHHYPTSLISSRNLNTPQGNISSPPPPSPLRTVSSLEYTPRNKFTPASSTQISTPIKITYKSPSTANPPNSQPNKDIYSSKEFRREFQTATLIAHGENFGSVRTVREPINHIVLSKSQSFRIVSPSPLVPQDKLNIEKCESSMLSDSIEIKIAEVEPQRVPMRHSWERGGEKGINRLAAFRSQQLQTNTRLPSIRKMDDVMEICSQADSQEGSQSNKESIVLGRLEEYSSAIVQQQGRGEAVSSLIDKKVLTRLAKIGSLNSTIGHCQSTTTPKQ